MPYPSVKVGWPNEKPGRPKSHKDLPGLSIQSTSFTRALEGAIHPRNSLILELGAGNGWYTGAIAGILDGAGKIFAADDEWSWSSPRNLVPFDTFVANRWDDREKIVPLVGSHVGAMRWIKEQKGTIDLVVVSNGKNQAENTHLLRSCWSIFPKTRVIGNAMLLDPNIVALRSPAGSVFINHRTHFEWTPAA